MSHAPMDSKSSSSPSLAHPQFTTPTMANHRATNVCEPLQSTQDQNVDKYAVLFSPSTPRPSPTLAPVSGGDVHDVSDTDVNPKLFDMFANPPEPLHRQLISRKTHIRRPQSVSSFSSDFGTFVSVPTDDDPLSSDIPAFEGDMLPPPMQATVSPAPSPTPHHSRPNSFILHNPSLNFFDKFAQDAKKATQTRRGVLDELLQHQDDPMYFLKDEVDKEAPKDPPPQSQPKPESPNENILDLELELDSDYFAQRRPQLIKQFSSPPSRSPSIPAPPTLAPPISSSPDIASELTASFLDPLDALSPKNTEDARPARSSSYQSFPSRWMSTLLRSTAQQSISATVPIPQGARPALESIFNNDTPASLGTSPKSKRRRSSAASVSPRNRQSQSVPASVQFTHNTPFAPSSITHSSSPFATHVYKPPSGAPGFKGEEYDWDKGFSNELERELELESASLQSRSSPLPILPSPSTGRNGVGGTRPSGRNRNLKAEQADRGMSGKPVPRAGVGEFIERKSGSVELEGRRASTTPVLSPTLAALLRPHLPALARLPRSWTLVYSLDQHGISLNTLYARCEAHSQPKPGELNTKALLLVIRDAGDTVFGAWLGEGIRQSKGKGYYGSGESFLWKYTKEELRVFKATGKNNYIAFCNPEYISFGGGDGFYGLYLEESLCDGSSAPCPTFDNEYLCSPGPKKAGAIEFECVGLEVWGMG